MRRVARDRRSIRARIDHEIHPTAVQLGRNENLPLPQREGHGVERRRDYRQSPPVSRPLKALEELDLQRRDLRVAAKPAREAVDVFLQDLGRVVEAIATARTARR